MTTEVRDGGGGHVAPWWTGEAPTMSAGLSQAQLDKQVVWAGRTWTVMGFLWGAYAHRAFHIGNIDIYLRQADVVAPEFFEFNPATMA